MRFAKFVFVVLALIVLSASSLLAVCNNCEPDPSSSTYASTAQSRPMLANARGKGPIEPVFYPKDINLHNVTLNLGSSSYSKAIPLLHLAGRNGLDVDLTLAYNSRVWTRDVKSTNKFTFNADRDWPAVGFRLGFGSMEIPPGNSTTTFIFTEPSGGKHAFQFSGTSPIHNSTDSTYMRYDSSAKVLTYKGGLQLTFEPFYLFNSTTTPGPRRRRFSA